jgi:hypothetical protein
MVKYVAIPIIRAFRLVLCFGIMDGKLLRDLGSHIVQGHILSNEAKSILLAVSTRQAK